MKLHFSSCNRRSEQFLYRSAHAQLEGLLNAPCKSTVLSNLYSTDSLEHGEHIGASQLPLRMRDMARLTSTYRRGCGFRDRSINTLTTGCR